MTNEMASLCIGEPLGRDKPTAASGALCALGDVQNPSASPIRVVVTFLVGCETDPEARTCAEPIAIEVPPESKLTFGLALTCDSGSLALGAPASVPPSNEAPGRASAKVTNEGTAEASITCYLVQHGTSLTGETTSPAASRAAELEVPAGGTFEAGISLEADGTRWADRLGAEFAAMPTTVDGEGLWLTPRQRETASSGVASDPAAGGEIHALAAWYALIDSRVNAGTGDLCLVLPVDELAPGLGTSYALSARLHDATMPRSIDFGFDAWTAATRSTGYTWEDPLTSLQTALTCGILTDESAAAAVDWESFAVLAGSQGYSLAGGLPSGWPSPLAFGAEVELVVTVTDLRGNSSGIDPSQALRLRDAHPVFVAHAPLDPRAEHETAPSYVVAHEALTISWSNAMLAPEPGTASTQPDTTSIESLSGWDAATSASIEASTEGSTELYRPVIVEETGAPELLFGRPTDASAAAAGIHRASIPTADDRPIRPTGPLARRTSHDGFDSGPYAPNRSRGRSVVPAVIVVAAVALVLAGAFVILRLGGDDQAVPASDTTSQTSGAAASPTGAQPSAATEIPASATGTSVFGLSDFERIAVFFAANGNPAQRSLAITYEERRPNNAAPPIDWLEGVSAFFFYDANGEAWVQIETPRELAANLCGEVDIITGNNQHVGDGFDFCAETAVVPWYFGNVVTFALIGDSSRVTINMRSGQVIVEPDDRVAIWIFKGSDPDSYEATEHVGQVAFAEEQDASTLDDIGKGTIVVGEAP